MTKNKADNGKACCLLLAAAALALTALIILSARLFFTSRHTHIELSKEEDIGPTPTQIASIRSIGEWELLAVSDEELVDTTREGILSDDHLARIYYGTLRLGVNLKDTRPGWIRIIDDTLTVTLPAVRLLDRDFIDEARTESFYEDGSWDGGDRQSLYSRAYRQMLNHCLIPSNLKDAETNGAEQMKKILSAMGYDKVKIYFEKPKPGR